MKTTRKPKSIQVIGRRWFNKTYGNTYFSVEVYIDGEFKARVPYEYGYGSQYEQRAAEILQAQGIKCSFPLSLTLREQGINYINSVTDVQRKRDL